LVVEKANGMPTVQGYLIPTLQRMTGPLLTAFTVAALALLLGVSVLWHSNLVPSAALLDASQDVICTSQESTARERPSDYQHAERRRDR
jgi:hypothetical protein